jgi:hypothetical protein
MNVEPWIGALTVRVPSSRGGRGVVIESDGAPCAPEDEDDGYDVPRTREWVKVVPQKSRWLKESV